MAQLGVPKPFDYLRDHAHAREAAIPQTRQ
jgi:hypothetical protein